MSANRKSKRRPDQPRMITVEFGLTDSLCASVMCTALEGGIGYWCVADKIKRTNLPNGDWDYLSFIAIDAESEVEPDAKGRRQFDKEEASFPDTLVDYAVIARGIQAILMPGSKVNATTKSNVLRAVTEQDGGEIDADDADYIVQCGLFGELVYG